MNISISFSLWINGCTLCVIHLRVKLSVPCYGWPYTASYHLPIFHNAGSHLDRLGHFGAVRNIWLHLNKITWASRYACACVFPSLSLPLISPLSLSLRASTTQTTHADKLCQLWLSYIEQSTDQTDWDQQPRSWHQSHLYWETGKWTSENVSLESQPSSKNGS